MAFIRPAFKYLIFLVYCFCMFPNSAKSQESQDFYYVIHDVNENKTRQLTLFLKDALKAFDQKCKDYHLFVTSPEAKEEIDACLEGCSDVYRNLVSSCKSACEKCKDCEEENKGFYQDCRQSCLSYKKKFLFGVQLTNLQVKDDNDMGIIQYEMEKVATTYNLLPSGNPVLKPDDMHSQKSGQVWCKEGRLYTNNYKIKDEFSKLSGVYFFFEKR